MFEVELASQIEQLSEFRQQCTIYTLQELSIFYLTFKQSSLQWDKLAWETNLH